jgi:rsbT co-antagonist protein RsbR
MPVSSASTIAGILEHNEAGLLQEWQAELSNSKMLRPDLIHQGELEQQCREFLHLLRSAVQHHNLNDVQTPEWGSTRHFLADISRSRVQQGFTPSEVALFIFSLKKPLFDRLRQEFQQSDGLADAIADVTNLLDQLGLWTMEVYQQAREDTIHRQQEELLELSTPVVKLWDGILALTIIGTLDSARTQVVMETLLQQIVETGSPVVIIDITGVPTVDTLVAQHLLKTVAAARLMGSDCIISGIRPQIAQTIVHLGVDLSAVITKATLADAFAIALSQQGLRVAPKQL